jgi:hypothetical protein
MKTTKARPLVILVPALFLAGCGSFPMSLIAASPYVPIPLKVFNQAQYDSDRTFCTDTTTLALYQPHLSIGDVGYGTLSGGAQNAAGGVIGGGLVTAAGAAGGGVSALVTGLDAFGKAKPNISRHCMNDLTQLDHSAIMARPED